MNQEEYNRNIEHIWDFIEAMNAPNPLNPGGISELAYCNVMSGLHDMGWVRDFVPGDGWGGDA